MTYAENRKARHEYQFLETFEAGLVLTGQEVKSIREGGMNLTGSYIVLTQGACWLIGAQIKPYSKAVVEPSYDPLRSRKLLLHQKEINYFQGKIQEKGLTMVPISVYPRGQRIKVSFAVAKGKKTVDKRETLKKRDLDREMQRAL